MWNYELTTIDEVIKTIKEDREEGYCGWIIENGVVSDKALVVDALDILDSMKYAEYTDISIEDFERIRDEYTNSENTYNWGANISNDLEIHCGFDSYGDIVTLIAVHRFGDIRCNYTDMVALKCDMDDLLSDDLDYKSVNIGDHYIADVYAWGSEYNVYDTNKCEHVGYYYESDAEELLKILEDEFGK